MVVANLKCIAVGKPLEVLGEIGTPRHSGPLHKHWDDFYVSFKGAGDFQPYQIRRVIYAPNTGSRRVGGTQPFTANHRNQPIANSDCLLNNLDKVQARLDGIDVHENLPLSELAFEAVE
jgi:hypothetical protein